MKAIKSKGPKEAEIQDVPIPTLRDDYVLVKVTAVAVNPTDWFTLDSFPHPGLTVGCDFAGVVEDVGPHVQKPWKKGDRIAGFAHGSNVVQPEDGCFAEYCIVKSELATKIPDRLTDEEACTLGVGITTVGQGLYQSLGLPLPGTGKANFPILINGASTATGSLAVQFARLSGCSPIVATASPHNFDFVKSRGADVVFDYNDPDCAEKIKAFTQDSLAHVFDCNSTQSSAAICSAAIGSKGGVVSYLQAVKHDREDVQTKVTLAYTANPADFEFATSFWSLAEKLLAEGTLQPHPAELGEGGLKGIFQGLDALREKRVSGKKLVYRVEENL
ncbi:chaperonin 10-like protein [Echria macrotheca]|uniref:Chaperonin 10-like protein n=1 Tax=Echria macrotheca TaxID=438768 RepID=A0AAJ0B7T7_9PEZI|nr:chaperonin 10-like protein [Echria macrotheca]